MQNGCYERFMQVPKSTSRLVWTGVIFLALIGVAAVTRRTLVLLWPETFAGKSSPAAVLDAGFARHMALTLVHILPGGLFLILAPLQFVPGIRQKHLKVHRWMGRILVLCGLIIGVSALIISYTMNIGGANETAATTLFAIVFLICLIKAYRHEFFGIAFWLGFTITFLVAEAWVEYTRQRSMLETNSAGSGREQPLAA
jgi:hypothetical protein